MPEWDIVAESTDGKKLLLGEAKWSASTVTARVLASESRALLGKPLPDLPARYARLEVIRALFVPELVRGVRLRNADCLVVTGRDLL